MDAVTRAKERFSSQFESDSLRDVKFFVSAETGLVSAADLFDEICRIEDALSAGKRTTIDSVDGELPQKRFDEAF